MGSALSAAWSIEVKPTNELVLRAKDLEIWLWAEGGLLFISLCLGYIWTLGLLGCMTFGYFAIKNKQAFKPQMLKYYFCTTVVGAITAGIYCCFAFAAIPPLLPLPILCIGAMVLTSAALVICAKKAWDMYLVLQTLPIFRTTATSPDVVTAMLGGSSEATRAPATSVPAGFVPFQGKGYKVGGT